MRIIYFDGVCNLCNHFVDFVLNRDLQSHFVFSSLQGQSAQKNLQPSDLGLDSVILFEDGQIYKKSKAVAKILKKLHFPYNFIGYVYDLIPLFLSDRIYETVAKYRYTLFGKKDTCRLPTPAERARFLD